MGDGRQDHEWTMASGIMYAALVPHTSKNKRLKPDDLNPRRKPYKAPVADEQLDEKQTMDLLKRVFSDPANIR